MNLEKRFKALKDFLLTHQFLHEQEVLEKFPHFPPLYNQWEKSVAKLNSDQKRAHENEGETEFIEDESYRNFIKTTKALCEIPKASFEDSFIPKELKRKMSLKKQHEIGIIYKQLQHQPIDHYIDIGSGAGHLSSVLLWSNNKTSLCIDQSHEFQEIGIKKLKREAPELLTRQRFKNQTFSSLSHIDFVENSSLVALHACGDLSVEVLKSFMQSKIKSVLNYACCYHKQLPKNLNLSRLAKDSPLHLTNHSLTLAAKSYKIKTKEDIQFRNRVKLYRYGLHLFLKEKFKKEFQTLGNAQKKDYNEDFSLYAKKYAEEILIETSNQELEDFINDSSTKQNITKLINMGIIRAQIARVVEVYIVIDRALYLKEMGLEVELLETFDRNISPRNISLIAKRV